MSGIRKRYSSEGKKVTIDLDYWKMEHQYNGSVLFIPREDVNPEVKKEGDFE